LKYYTDWGLGDGRNAAQRSGVRKPLGTMNNQSFKKHNISCGW
jgi:hypothetical protein